MLNGEIVYTQSPYEADYPRGYYKGAISITKVRNLLRKHGLEIVNGLNNRVNNVLEGSSGFIRREKDGKDGRLVYFNTDGYNGQVLFREAADERDYTGGTNNYCPFGALPWKVLEMLERGDSLAKDAPWGNPYRVRRGA